MQYRKGDRVRVVQIDRDPPFLWKKLIGKEGTVKGSPFGWPKVFLDEENRSFEFHPKELIKISLLEEKVKWAGKERKKRLLKRILEEDPIE